MAIQTLSADLLAVVTKCSSPRSLLLVVYEGHSSALNLPSGGSEVLIYGANTPQATTVRWSLVDNMIGGCRGDVVVIMDSCYSTAAALDRPGREYVFASSFESPTPASLQICFTRRLIDCLRQVNGKTTIAQLHARLLVAANQPGHQLQVTPVYVANYQKPSVTLEPLPTGLISRPELRGLQATGQLSDGKVLLSGYLKSTTSIPEVNQWKAWLAREIPEAVADIKIEAVFHSTSCVCLLTVPTAVWHTIRNDEAYKFIAFVDSHNLLTNQFSNA
ncbi:hypothetical protein ASPZODRAFT_1008019 [Penicilliopsis zonata CBS 506.65]|uniref:Uncharacterized protein n=1 Tax=Penicilliopsis zonata CBS 506.65 TaxID=1073090 RepID=A0A1L9SRH3_9EURO|nr:hypothetical protein ASPZODRAFT_1008019 [Penicilliopsis zonata CBS 506.65]OJJ49723.1 hypothetical protein ASPZODRAFT_1008019 [Penicilliopsis zonata CBS 506.65]